MFKRGDVLVGNKNCHNPANVGKRCIALSDQLSDGTVQIEWEGESGAPHVNSARLDYLNGPGSGINDGKADGGKVDPGMLFQGCARALRGVLSVLEFGAKKYAADSWRKVPNAMSRYHAAFQRHKQTTDIEGLWARDPETGLYEVDHMITNLLFLRELKAAEDAGKP